MSRLYNTFKNIFIGGAQKTTGTGAINSVNIAKNLAKKKNIKDDLVKARDKQLANVRDEAKVEIKSKNPLSKFTKKIENIVDRKDESIAMRVKKKRTAKQLKASADDSYGKFGSKAKKSGKINR